MIEGLVEGVGEGVGEGEGEVEDFVRGGVEEGGTGVIVLVVWARYQSVRYSTLK